MWSLNVGKTEGSRGENITELYQSLPFTQNKWRNMLEQVSESGNISGEHKLKIEVQITPMVATKDSLTWKF